MSKRKKKVHWKNPPNPYLNAWLDTWRRYTCAYHDDAPKHILDDLYSKFMKAKQDYADNPQRIFSEKDMEQNMGA